MSPDRGAPPPLPARVLSWLPAAGLMAAIFWLSSIPGDSLPLPDFRFSDKAVHFLAYAVLGVLIAARRPLRARLAPPPKPAFAAEAPPRPFDWTGAATGILYGLADEVHQLFVPLRMFDMTDWVADALGVLAGLWLCARQAERARAARAATTAG